MAIKEVRKYKCPDSTMLDGADVIQTLYVEDELIFQGYNIIMFPVTFKTIFLAKITAARNVLKDMVVVDGQKEETEEVTEMMKECMAYFQIMKPVITFTFPNKPALWDKFGFNDYENSRRSQGRMVQFMEMLVSTTEEYKVELIAKGYTQLKIDKGAALAEAIRQEQTEQEHAKKDRPYETQERIIIMNACWDVMVYVTSAAKAVFYGNFAKLHQYILPEGSSYEQHTYKSPIAGGGNANVLMQVFKASDEITLEAAGADLMYGLMETVDGVVAVGIVVPAGVSKTVTAADLGDVTQCSFLNVSNKTVSDGSYKVVV